MGGRGASSGHVSAMVRQNALTWAKSQVGSTAYAKKAVLGDWKKNSWKCNAFVTRAFNQNTIPDVINQKSTRWGLTQRAYSANEFHKGEVPGFKRVETPKVGDIATNGKHVDIVSGNGKTISATEHAVVENDWGFRTNNRKPEKAMRFYRYTGDK